MIALWLGHEQLTTTHGYIEADLTMKQQCVDRLRRQCDELADTAPHICLSFSRRCDYG
jgi:hypothetical protein